MADEMELDNWRETFGLFDKKGNGFIECSVIGELMRALGQNPTQAEVERIRNEIDPKGEKEVSFEEFVPLMKMQRKNGEKDMYVDFAEGFKVFDRENNGMVNLGEVRTILMNMGEALEAGEADMLFEGVGVDNNGQINYEEFIRAVMNG